jgi:hypothetical protein
LENGVRAIRLGDVSIAESMPPSSKDNLKIALAFVLIKNALLQRKL